MVFLNVWCTHTDKSKPESPSLKIFRHWKIYNQNKANLWSMNFPSKWSKPLVFVFLYSERWNFLLCDTLMLTKHKEVRQEGISFHKKKNGLASLLLQRGIIWQIASNLKFPWEKKKSREEKKGNMDVGICLSLLHGRTKEGQLQRCSICCVLPERKTWVKSTVSLASFRGTTFIYTEDNSWD